MQFVVDENTALTSFKNSEVDTAIATYPDWERYREEVEVIQKSSPPTSTIFWDLILQTDIPGQGPSTSHPVRYKQGNDSG